mgnify:CR=1 FL=1
MNIPNSVNILGTEYKIIKTDKDDSIFEGSDSACIVRKTDKKFFIATEGACDGIIKNLLVNCIIRIFLYESGIHSNSIDKWAINDEMFGWMALQFDKISNVIKKIDRLQKDLTEVRILGVKYKILYCENASLDSEFSADPNIGAYIDYYEKNIIVKKESDNFKYFLQSTILHEVIHGFLFESGLNSESTDNWAENEEMVDWFALQFRKIEKVVDTIR